MSEAPASGERTVDVVIPARDPGPALWRCLDATLAQTLPADWGLALYVVDDGSAHDLTQSVRARHGDRVTVLRHAENLGRGAALNTGFSAGAGRYVVFLDADCVWAGPEGLGHHLATLDAGADVSVGLVGTDDTGFWADYQRAVFDRRLRAFRAGDRAALTSANCAARRAALAAVGGFDPGYRQYGFEDRDFYLRLLAAGRRIALCEASLVLHADRLTLAGVAGKMYLAGRHSAARFRAAHPAHYAGMPYHRLDAQARGPALGVAAVLARPLLPWLVAAGERVIAGRWAPAPVKRAWVKLASGLAFLRGTHDARRAG